jgi:D-3-phosphoglycerate dehydrogenase
MAVTQVRNYLELGNIKNSVNFPECEMAPSEKNRIVVANRNVPNMVGQITTILAEASINIKDMLNKSQGDVAYNIIDVENEVTEDDLQKIRAIEGVVMTRLIQID